MLICFQTKIILVSYMLPSVHLWYEKRRRTTTNNDEQRRTTTNHILIPNDEPEVIAGQNKPKQAKNTCCSIPSMPPFFPLVWHFEYVSGLFWDRNDRFWPKTAQIWEGTSRLGAAIEF